MQVKTHVFAKEFTIFFSRLRCNILCCDTLFSGRCLSFRSTRLLQFR